tara:strand:+ start:3819 stop:5924 length:2106 start_codon:yes stop_codon:yes gene_type:complete
MSESNQTIQSVILNLNTNFSNSKASNYFQPVSQKLDIGKNAEVSLYGASLKRKPILLTKDTVDNKTLLNIEQFYYPTNEANIITDPDTILDEDSIPSVELSLGIIGRLSGETDYKIEAGDYTIDELGQRIVAEINSDIVTDLNGQSLLSTGGLPLDCGGTNMVVSFPYNFIFDNTKDFFLGYAGSAYQQSFTNNNPNISGYFCNSQLETVDNSETVTTTGALLLNVERETSFSMKGIKNVTSNVAISTTNYQSFSQLHFSSLFPLYRQNKANVVTSVAKECETYFEFNLKMDSSKNNRETDMVVGFINTYLQSGWANTNIPNIDKLEPDNVNVPRCFVGCRIVEDKSGSNDINKLQIIAPNLLTRKLSYLNAVDPIANLFTDGMIVLKEIDIDEVSKIGRCGFRFYAVDNQYNFYSHQLIQGATSISGGRPTFEKVYGFQFYCADSGDTTTLLYDSGEDNVFIPGNLLEDGFLFNAANSSRNPGGEFCNLGFQPYMFVNKLEEGDGISMPRGNYICQKDHTLAKIDYRVGLKYYTFNTKNKSLLDVLGLQEDKEQTITVSKNNDKILSRTGKKFDANAYPVEKNLGGFTKLYSDNTQYNIEINLPVKAFNTTEQTIGNSNDIGQKRTIIYKTEPILEGEIQDLNQSFITKDIVPNNLKYLTLNNTVPLNINNMNVQIRRAKTNELATELDDASVEILIKSN